MKTIVCNECKQYIGCKDKDGYSIIADIDGEWVNMNTKCIPEDAKCVQCGADIIKNKIEEEVY